MSTADPITRLNAALQGRYRIEREIGEGGMATVYLAEDLRHHRRVALKVLKPALAAAVGAERFLAEIRTTANLTHPNILPLHDSGEAAGAVFYVMPYVEDESLRQRLDRERQLPVEEAVRIAKEVAEALDHAHRQGVVHRDVKPANILLRDGRPLIADFGIALAASRSAGAERLTETGLSLGTPSYMSPEQATGDQTVGPPTDVYALGCVLYEMLVGEPPYTGSTAQALLGRIIMGEPTKASKERPTVPPNVDAAILKALEKVPADRFRSADGFAEALGDPAFRYGTPATAHAAGGRSRRKAAALAPGAAAVVFAVLFLWALNRPEPPRQETRLEIPLPALANDPVDLSADGSSVVYATIGQPGQLFHRPIGVFDAVPIQGTEGAEAPAFSPGGDSVAYRDSEGRLRVVGLAGGPPRTVHRAEGTSFGLSWGDDGWIYFSVTPPTLGIQRIRVVGSGDAERVTSPPDGVAHRWPDVLPGGKGILFTEAPDPHIAVWVADTGDVRRLFPGDMAEWVDSGHIVYCDGEGALRTVPFDIETLEAQVAEGRTLDEGMEFFGSGLCQFAVARGSGTVMYELPAEASARPVLVDPSDGSEDILDPALVGEYMQVAVCPDSGRVAFWKDFSYGRIHVWDEQSRTERLLTEVGASSSPYWSPDCEAVGFASNRELGRPLYARAWDGTAAATLVRRFEGPIFEAQPTRNGEGIVYRIGLQGPAADLWYSAHPDSVPVAVSDTEAEERGITISPDDGWVAYQRDVEGEGNFEIYAKPLPGPGPEVKISAAGGVAPLWSRDGSEIIYVDRDENWVVATVRTEPTFEVLEHRTLASASGLGTATRWQGGRRFDWAPDGRRILAIRTPPGPSSPSWGVVQNLFD